MRSIGMNEPPALTEPVVRVVGAGVDEIATVYEACHRDLFGYVVSLTHDHSSAEDVVHEGFARLVKEYATGRSPENARAWLYTVCTNLTFSRSRRRAIVDRWHRLVGQTSAIETQDSAETTVLRRERYTELTRALGRLPTDHRAALLLAADGFSGREIATILDRSEGATRNSCERHRFPADAQRARGA